METLPALPTNILIIVLAMILWALAFAQLAPGFRIILDTKSTIQVSWVQIGWAPSRSTEPTPPRPNRRSLAAPGTSS